MDFSVTRSKKREKAKFAGREAPTASRRNLETLPAEEFKRALDGMKHVSQGWEDEIIALRRSLPFADKRYNPIYLAGAYILWIQLGRPSASKIPSISPEKYDALASNVEGSVIRQQNLQKKDEAEGTVLSARNVPRPSSTLFRYLLIVARDANPE